MTTDNPAVVELIERLRGFAAAMCEYNPRLLSSGYGGFSFGPDDYEHIATTLQSLSERIALLEGENADLVHDLERQMTIANIECNEAEELRRILRDIRLFLPNVAQMLDEMKVERSFRHIDWTDYNQEQRELLTALMRRIDALSNEEQSG